MTRACVLVPRGYSVGRDRAVQRFAERLADDRGEEVLVGFLDGGTPTLVETLARCGGHDSVLLIPLANPADPNLARWARLVAADWASRHPDGPRLALADSPPDSVFSAALGDVMAADGSPIVPTAGAISDPEWSRIPAYRHHVLVCRGPRCSARGAAANAAALSAALAARGLGDDDVLVTRTGCLFPCNLGPMLAVQPDDVWYGALTPERVDRIVAEHLCAGGPVEELAIPRG